MDHGLKTLSDLFAGRRIFSIPRYQRAYAWEERQLVDFFQDFLNQREDKDYFFGTILFQERGTDGGFEGIEVVDGQQRLTTLSVFVRIVHERMAAKGATTDELELLEETYLAYKNRQKLRAIPTDREFFATYVLGTDKPPEPETPSQRRLLDAVARFRELLEPLGLDELRSFVGKIDKTRVLTYSVTDSAEATLIFETTNDRGKPLTDLEKTKSFLMYQTYLSCEPGEADDRLDILQDRFARIYRTYESIEERVEEDAVLRYHFIAFQDWTSNRKVKEYRQNVQTAKRQLTELSAESGDAAKQYIEDYSSTLTKAFGHLRDIYEAPPALLADLQAIGLSANFVPLLLKMWAYRTDEHAGTIDRIVKLLEIFAYRIYGVRQKRTDTARENFYDMAWGFEGDFEALLEKLRALAVHWANDRDFAERLRHGRFFENGGNKRYLLWKYENHLRAAKQPKAPPLDRAALVSKDRSLLLSIEHIAPQTPGKGTVVESGEVLPDYTDDFRENWVHSLGNLTIDPQSANSSKKNISFEQKYKGYFRLAPFKTQTELGDFLEDGRWTRASIEKRREVIVEFAMREWDPRLV